MARAVSRNACAQPLVTHMHITRRLANAISNGAQMGDMLYSGKEVPVAATWLVLEQQATPVGLHFDFFSHDYVPSGTLLLSYTLKSRHSRNLICIWT